MAVAVADGLGGLLGGEFAANLAVQVFSDTIRRSPRPDLREVIGDIHAAIIAEQQRDTNKRSMATTFSGALLEGDHLYGVHCGDTRVSIARNKGIMRLTTDHTEAQRLYQDGKLSRSELAVYPRKNILASALGIQGSPKIDTFSIELLAGDRILLTSDGFHNRILLREARKLLDHASSPQHFCLLIQGEMELRKPDDNYSVIVVFID